MSSPLQLDEQAIRTIVEDVMRGLGRAPSAAASAPVATRRPGPHFGVFTEVKDACAAAQGAFEQLRNKGVAGRAKVVEIVKDLCTGHAAAWGKFEFEETKIGRLEHKIAKLEIVKLVPGVEWLRPRGMSGDHGITLEEHTPFGVVGAVLPLPLLPPPGAAVPMSVGSGPDDDAFVGGDSSGAIISSTMSTA
jgi:aldehyde dehydrogenase